VVDAPKAKPFGAMGPATAIARSHFCGRDDATGIVDGSQCRAYGEHMTTIDTRAAAAAAAIEEAGGLVSAADLARDWGVTKQRVHVAVRSADFPAALTTVSGRPVWARCQTDQWRSRHSSR
jgi:hypothetical protein